MRIIGAAALALMLGVGAAAAGDAWDDIRAELYGDRAITAGGVALTAPTRAADDRRVSFRAHAADPAGVRAVTFIIDENPMPVSAVFDVLAPTTELDLDVTMRLNGPSMVRVVVETGDGALRMAEAMVKTSGLGACAAPPSTDAKLALQTLGQMALAQDAAADLAARAAGDAPMARLAISHPSHSGMQMDQVTLLFTPARYVETLEIWADDAPLLRMTGSISLSENPEIAFTRPDAAALRARITETGGGIYERRFGLGAS
ncbi:MAG: quinoprotein dehydrogenase-associated SoxYZ-like carrier [Rubrimonas sp.]